MTPKVLTPIKVELFRIDLKRIHSGREYTDDYTVQATARITYSDSDGMVIPMTTPIEFKLSESSSQPILQSVIDLCNKALCDKVGVTDGR